MMYSESDYMKTIKRYHLENMRKKRKGVQRHIYIDNLYPQRIHANTPVFNNRRPPDPFDQTEDTSEFDFSETDSRPLRQPSNDMSFLDTFSDAGVDEIDTLPLTQQPPRRKPRSTEVEMLQRDIFDDPGTAALTLNTNDYLNTRRNAYRRPGFEETKNSLVIIDDTGDRAAEPFLPPNYDPWRDEPALAQPYLVRLF
jgi:hypothetical protein